MDREAWSAAVHGFAKIWTSQSDGTELNLQQYLNQELPEVQAGFSKGRGTRDPIANKHWITEKAREFQKNTYFCFIDYTKASDCVDHKNFEKFIEMGIPDHITYLW